MYLVPTVHFLTMEKFLMEIREKQPFLKPTIYMLNLQLSMQTMKCIFGIDTNIASMKKQITQKHIAKLSN